MNYRHLVVAIDFHEPSRLALHEAGQIAEGCEAELTAIHMVTRETVRTIERHAPESLEAHLKRTEQKLLSWLDAEVPEPVKTHTLIKTGSPSKDLVTTVDEMGGDLLVVGSHGKAGRPQRIGAVALNLVRHSKFPSIWICRNQKRFERVIACIDYSPSSESVMQHAIAVAISEGAVLEVVHAVPLPMDASTEFPIQGFGHFGALAADPETIESTRQCQRRTLEQFVDQYVTPPGIDLVIKTVIEDLSPSRAIISHLEKTWRPIVVLGSHGNNRIYEHILGTTTEKVLHQATNSALIIRKPEPPKSA